VLKSNVRDSNAEKGAWNLRGIVRVFSVWLKLMWRLASFRPNVVYLTLSQNSAGLARDLLYIFACSIFHVPIIAHLHGSQLKRFLDGLPIKRRQWVLGRLSRISTIVVCGQGIASEIEALLPDVRIEAVYNAIPLDVQEFPEKSIKENERLVIAFMGHLSFAKGFFDLLEATRRLKAEAPKVLFRFAGERVERERNISIDRNGVGGISGWADAEVMIRESPGTFEEVGIVTGDSKRRFFEGADIFVLPSHSEAFPVSVLEAMAAGLPMVLSPVGALPEVIIPDKNALFVEPGRPQELAAALGRLVRDSELRRKMGKANRNDVKRFSIAAMADSIAIIFDEVVTRGKQ